MTSTLLASILSVAAIATALSTTAAPAAAKTRVVPCNPSDLRTHKGAAKFRYWARVALAKVCATLAIPDFQSSVE